MKKLEVTIPRLALTPPQAAAAIGVGPDFFDEQIAPELRVIRRGRKRLFAVEEIKRWLADSSEVSVAQQMGSQ